MLKAGDLAPEIDLLDQHGRRFKLSSLRGHKNAVLFFYPRANTAVCTMEACAFRDQFSTFATRDTEVIGISSDSQEDQLRFAMKHKLPYLLLCDTHLEAVHAFGIGRWMGLLRNRVTFVIDRSGTIKAVIHGRFLAEHHVREALRAIS